MHSIVETLAFLLFGCLGIALYGRVLYVHCMQKTQNPDYAKKTVLNITIRFILLLLLMAIVSSLNQYFHFSNTVFYGCLLILFCAFLLIMKKIRSVLRDS